jgi:hypothetical protein
VVSEELSATFEAQFPDIQSAVKFGRDSIRIQLDVPIGPGYAQGEENKREVTRALDWFGNRLAVVIVPLADDNTLTDFDDATEEGTERGAPILDRRRSAKRRV